MKTTTKKVLPLILIFCVQISFAQTIRIANNNPGATAGTNVYTGATSLQAAINASVDGDIIHVIPSSTSYGNITISKSITVLGVGLNPQKNIGQRSIVGDISLNEATCSGTRISGLHFLALLMGNTVGTYTVSNILIENNQFNRVNGPNVQTNSIANLIVRNCVINASNFGGEPQAFEIYTNSGVIITNNIIRGFGAIAGDGLTIQNNLFYYAGTSSAFFEIDNCNVQNNIFVGCTPAVGTNSTGNSFIFNLVFASNANSFTSGVNANSASNNIVQDPLLTSVPLTNNFWNYSNDITLQAGSPALNAGQDGTNIGPTGGTTPFDREGTFLPLIETINVPAVVTQGTNLEVNIKAKGN